MKLTAERCVPTYTPTVEIHSERRRSQTWVLVKNDCFVMQVQSSTQKVLADLQH